MHKTENAVELYTVEKAIDFVKENAKTKFDGSIEVHINLKLDVTKADQTIRTTTTLPNGTGKSKKIAVFASQPVKNADLELSDNDISKIEQGTLKPKIDFDVIVAEPRFMPKIAKVAKILGPAGVMPNPKTGTVTEDVKKAVDQIKKGKIEIRNEQTAPIIHTIIGRTSFSTKELKENLSEVLNTLKQNKPAKAKPEWIKSVFLASTMGPSAQIDLNTL